LDVVGRADGTISGFNLVRLAVDDDRVGVVGRRALVATDRTGGAALIGVDGFDTSVVGLIDAADRVGADPICSRRSVVGTPATAATRSTDGRRVCGVATDRP
jgi:hypothetical protein